MILRGKPAHHAAAIAGFPLIFRRVEPHRLVPGLQHAPLDLMAWLSLLILALLLAIVGLSAFGAFFSKVADRFAAWAGIAAPSGLLLRDVIQLVAIAVTVLLLYRFVPARRLRRRGALAGAILTAVGIWGTTRVLGVIFRDFSRYNVIYGSLATVMTFLFLVYVIAWILLLGAEFAYAWSQPPGPPGPPIRTQLFGAIRALFVHHQDEAPTEERARRP